MTLVGHVGSIDVEKNFRTMFKPTFVQMTKLLKFVNVVEI